MISQHNMQKNIRLLKRSYLVKTLTKSNKKQNNSFTKEILVYQKDNKNPHVSLKARKKIFSTCHGVSMPNRKHNKSKYTLTLKLASIV